MYALNRYIIKQIAFVSFLLIAVLTLLLWLTHSIHYLEFLFDGSADLGAFMKLLSLTIPNILGVVTSIAFGVSVVFIFNKLINERELIVMRASGFDNIQFLKSVLFIAGILVVFLYVLTLEIIPMTQGKLVQMKRQFLTSASTSIIKAGQFNHIEGITIYVGSKTSHSVFNDILSVDNRDPLKSTTIIAERAEIKEQEKGLFSVTAYNGYRQEKDLKTDKIDQVFFGTYQFEYSSKAIKTEKKKGTRALDLEGLNLKIKRTTDKRKLGKVYLEKHSRLTTPLYALIFGVGAGYLMIYSSFRRVGQIKQILKTALFIVVLESWVIVQASLIKKHYELYWLMYLVPISVILIGCFLIFSQNKKIQG